MKYRKIIEDEELKKLYLDDALFNKTMQYAEIENISFEDALILAVKHGYKAKEQLFNDFVACKQNCARPNVIYCDMLKGGK